MCVPRWRTRMFPDEHRLAAVHFHTQALALAITTIAAGTATFFVSHIYLSYSHVRSRSTSILQAGVLLAVTGLDADALLGLVAEDDHLWTFDLGRPRWPAPWRRRPAGCRRCTLSPSTTRSTRSRSICFADLRQAKRSTSMVPPSTALYCLPPSSTIAYFISFLQASLRHTALPLSGTRLADPPVCAAVSGKLGIDPFDRRDTRYAPASTAGTMRAELYMELGKNVNRF